MAQPLNLPTAQPLLPTAQQFEAWRKMTPTEKYRLFQNHMRMVRKVKTAGVRSLHPDWTESQIAQEVARIYVHART